MKLFAKNIRDKSCDAQKLTQILLDLNAAHEFTVDRIIKGTPLKAKITCKTIASSCEIQCLSALRLIRWEYHDAKKRETCSGKIQIVPDEESLAHKPRININFENDFLRLFHKFPPIVSYIAKYLNEEERRRAFEAFFEPEALLKEEIKESLDFSFKKFQGEDAIARLNKSIMLRKPVNLIAKCETSAVTINKVLNIISKRFKSEKNPVIELELVDLTGVF